MSIIVPSLLSDAFEAVLGRRAVQIERPAMEEGQDPLVSKAEKMRLSCPQAGKLKNGNFKERKKGAKKERKQRTGESPWTPGGPGSSPLLYNYNYTNNCLDNGVHFIEAIS